MPKRTTVYLDEEVLATVRTHISQRGLSDFINRALAEKAAALERARIDKLMIEGYVATREDRAELAEEWRAVETEGWPD
jgi:hypothetical protein